MRCPHCGREVIARRTGEGVRVRTGRGRPHAFVITSQCPHPLCSRLVFALVPSSREGLELTTMKDVTAWSLSAFCVPLAGWSWPLGVLLVFAVVPVWGLRAAIDSLRCGSLGWLFFVTGSLLALVPVLCLFRGLAYAAYEEVTVAFESRAVLRGGGKGGMSLVPDPRSYRSH